MRYSRNTNRKTNGGGPNPKTQTHPHGNVTEEGTVEQVHTLSCKMPRAKEMRSIGSPDSNTSKSLGPSPLLTHFPSEWRKQKQLAIYH